jgi:hypothetical protein
MLAEVEVLGNILVLHQQHLEVLVVVELVQRMQVTQQVLPIILAVGVVVVNQRQMDE